MKEKISQRIDELKREYDTGIKLQADYVAKQKDLQETLLRISGAIQILEEVLAEADSEANGEVSQPKEIQAETQPQG